MSKVENRRNREIDSSASAGKWSEVSRLLDQSFQNLERKGRKYGLSSLNSLTVTEGKTTELIDFIDDDTYNPEKDLLRKERSEYLDKALQKLSEDDLHIFLEVALKGSAFLTGRAQRLFQKKLKKFWQEVPISCFFSPYR